MQVISAAGKDDRQQRRMGIGHCDKKTPGAEADIFAPRACIDKARRGSVGLLDFDAGIHAK